MTKRVLPLAAAVAVLMFVGAAVAADKAADKDKAASTVTGTISKVSADSITVTDKDGKDHQLSLGKNAVVTIDGNAGKVTDLKEKSMVTVTLNADNKTQADKIDVKTK
jgi:hypothetical protein